MASHLGILVHVKVFCLVIKLLFQWLWIKLVFIISNWFYALFHFLSGLWLLREMKMLGKRKQAIVILTKISTRDNPQAQLAETIGKQNAYFLERIMTENLAFMLTKLKKELLTQNKELSLFVCYQHKYYYKYIITDWLEHLPNYSNRLEPLKDISSSIDERFQTLKVELERNRSKLDLSFDADSFCTTNSTKCSRSAKSVFKYVCVEDAADGRALEAAIRVAFHHNNQDVIVLNPHAITMTDKHIKDSLSYLEENTDLKNRIIYGKTTCGSLYLLGVSRSRDILLNIRRLTNNVIWGSVNAFKVISEHNSKLQWSGACLRSVLEDVNCIESLPLVERELGLQMEHIPNDLITIVIPTYNHEEYIEEMLESLVHHLSGKRSIQIVAIDASSTDYTLTKLNEFRKNIHKYLSSSTSYSIKGQTVYLKKSCISKFKKPTNEIIHKTIDLNSLITMEIYSLPKDLNQRREEQVRYAVKNYAKGGTLLILRPGTNLPLYWDISIRRCLNQLGVIMGTFSFHLYLHDRYIERKNIGWALRCYLMNWIFNIRSKKYEMPSGDQGFFMYTYYYRLLNHGRTRVEPAVLDDIELITRVHSSGHINTCDANVTVCPLKALQFGFCRSWLLDSLIIAAFKLGADPDELEKHCNDLMVVKPDYFDGY